MTNRWKKFRSYLRRQTPWFYALALVLLFVPLTVYLLPWFTHWLFDAPPAQLGGPDLSAAQEAASRQAMSIPLGIVLSRLVAAVLFFLVAVGVVWWTMHRITPALPTWAKKDFSAAFTSLPDQWKFAVYITCWGLLLYLFAQALYAASLVQ